MKHFPRNISTLKRTAEAGFTLIELLIVIALLGILAAIVIPNVASFIKAGNVAAANIELAAVQTAAQTCFAENPGTGAFTTSDAPDPLLPYLNSTPKGVYSFNASGAFSADPIYGDLNWDASKMQFIR